MISFRKRRGHLAACVILGYIEYTGGPLVRGLG
jgi:hypothetical protein